MGFRTDGQPESLLSTGRRGHLWESRQVSRVCVAGASIPACTCHDGEALRNLDDMIGLCPPPWKRFSGVYSCGGVGLKNLSWLLFGRKTGLGGDLGLMGE